jgi:hypothetical protein
VRRKWPLWTELVGGGEWRPHAPCGAKSKKKKKKKKKKVNMDGYLFFVILQLNFNIFSFKIINRMIQKKLKND